MALCNRGLYACEQHRSVQTAEWKHSLDFGIVADALFAADCKDSDLIFGNYIDGLTKSERFVKLGAWLERDLQGPKVHPPLPTWYRRRASAKGTAGTGSISVTPLAHSPSCALGPVRTSLKSVCTRDLGVTRFCQAPRGSCCTGSARRGNRRGQPPSTARSRTKPMSAQAETEPVDPSDGPQGRETRQVVAEPVKSANRVTAEELIERSVGEGSKVYRHRQDLRRAGESRVRACAATCISTASSRSGRCSSAANGIYHRLSPKHLHRDSRFATRSTSDRAGDAPHPAPDDPASATAQSGAGLPGRISDFVKPLLLLGPLLVKLVSACRSTEPGATSGRGSAVTQHHAFNCDVNARHANWPLVASQKSVVVSKFGGRSLVG